MPGGMDRAIDTLRDAAAFTLVMALLAVAVGVALTVRGVVGGLPGVPAGLVAAVLAVEALRMPVGRGIALLVR